jgi:hypothetical protein
MRVLIQLRTTRQLRAAFAAEEHVPPSATAAEALTPLGLVVDEGFDPVDGGRAAGHRGAVRQPEN